MRVSADGTCFEGATAAGNEAYLIMAGDYLMITREGFGATSRPSCDFKINHTNFV